MAKTATKRKAGKTAKGAKKSAKPVTSARRRPSGNKASTNGKAGIKSAGPGKFDPKQPPLPEMADVDERIPALDDKCQEYLAAVDKKGVASDDMKESLDKVGDLLKKHDLDQYVLNGKKFFIEPGSPSVKCKNVSMNGM